MNIRTDPDRAELLVRILDDAYTQRLGILENISNLVENQIPSSTEHLSEGHARFLFYSVYNDHGMKSSLLYERAKSLFEEHPEYYDPFFISSEFHNNDVALIATNITTHLGVRYPSQSAISWLYNSHRLIERFDGSLIRLFKSTDNAKELLSQITSFRGYGQKTGGMLLRAIAGLGFAELSGLAQVLVPVDIHDSRISFFTGLLATEDQTQQIDYYRYSRIVQELLSDAARKQGISWLNIDRALWLIGSNGCVNLKCNSCPLKSMCAIGQRVAIDRGAFN